MPDTSETYERAHPEKTPGMGEMGKPDLVPDERPDSVQGSTRNDDDPPELAGQDPTDRGDVVQPESGTAHGDRVDPAATGGSK